MAVTMTAEAMLKTSAQECGDQTLVTVVVAISSSFAVTGEKATEVPMASVSCAVAE